VNCVLVTWPDFDPNDAGSGARLLEASCRLRLRPKNGARTAGEMIDALRGVAAAIVSTDPFDAAVLEAAPELRVIARVGVGIDSIDVQAATRRGIAVCVTPGVNAETTADHAVALMLSALRRIPEHDSAVRGGRWPRTGGHSPWELTGLTVGLVGLGKIGRLVARRLEGFGVALLACDPSGVIDGLAEPVDLPTLLRESHVVSLHTPLTADTRGIIGRRQLATMRRDAVLVNTARGGLIDEEALADALIQGTIRAAALDVFAEEPPTASRLLALPNVVLTPHTGGVSTRSVGEMLSRATSDVLDVLAGRRPAGLVNSPSSAGVVR